MKSELTQIREGAIKVRNWKIVVMILTLLLVQAVLGRMDSEAQLAEAERLAALHHSASLGRTVAATPPHCAVTKHVICGAGEAK